MCCTRLAEAVITSSGEMYVLVETTQIAERANLRPPAAPARTYVPIVGTMNIDHFTNVHRAVIQIVMVCSAALWM